MIHTLGRKPMHFLFFMLALVGYVNLQGQCVSSTQIGPPPCGRSIVSYGLILPGACNAPSTYSNFSPNTYAEAPLLAGGCYTISTCGDVNDTYIAIFQNTSSPTPIAWDDANGPDCNSAQASVTIIPSFVDYAVIDIYGSPCSPTGGTSSITMSIRQNNNLNITSNNAARCAGQTVALTATPAALGVVPGIYGSSGVFSGPNVVGTTFTAPNPVGNSMTSTITYSFGFCSTTQTIESFHAPSPANAGSDIFVCDTVATISATPVTFGTGTWLILTGPGTIASPSSPTTVLSGLVPGTPTQLVWRVTNGVCTASQDFLMVQSTMGPAPTGDTLLQLCSTSTVGDLVATGSNIEWYAAAVGGSPLSSTTVLTDSAIYYAAQTVIGCPSYTRFPVRVVLDMPIMDLPVRAQSNQICPDSSAILILDTTEVGYYYIAENDLTSAQLSGPLLANGSQLSIRTVPLQATTTVRVRSRVDVKGLEFDGVDDFVSTPVTLSGDQGSWEAWVQRSDWATATEEALFSNGLNFGTAGSFYASLHPIVGFHVRYGGTGELGNNYAYYIPSRAFEPNSWHHLAVTWSHALGSTTLTLYIDGQFVASDIATLQLGASPNMKVGGDGVTAASFFGPGKMHDVRFWSQTRTAQEIATNYLNTLTGNETGLLALYRMQETSGNTAADATPSLFAGILNNFDLPSAWGPIVYGCLPDNQVMSQLQTIRVDTQNVTTVIACGDYTWPVNNQTYTFSRTDTLQQGCLREILQLTIEPVPVMPSGDTTQSFCDAATVADLAASGGGIQWYLAPMGDTVLTSTTPLVAGTTYYATQTLSGCESATRLPVVVSINASSTGIDTQSACNSFTWIDGNTYFSSNTTATHVIPNAAGCDSLVLLNLTLNQQIATSQTIDLCFGESITVGSNTYSTAGTYTDVFTALNGCDSTVTTNLSIAAAIQTTQSPSLCAGESLVVGANTYSLTGTYVDTLVASAGCDSVVTTVLTILAPVNVATTTNNATITATAAGLAYQWINCDNGNAPIFGETAQSFTAQTGGNYAVIVTDGNCSDTSACEPLIVIGTNGANTLPEVQIYPNPTNGIVQVALSQAADVRIIDPMGKVIYQGRLEIGTHAIDLQAVSAGVYFVRCEMDGQYITRKLIKK